MGALVNNKRCGECKNVFIDEYLRNKGYSKYIKCNIDFEYKTAATKCCAISDSQYQKKAARVSEPRRG